MKTKTILFLHFGTHETPVKKKQCRNNYKKAGTGNKFIDYVLKSIINIIIIKTPNVTIIFKGRFKYENLIYMVKKKKIRQSKSSEKNVNFWFYFKKIKILTAFFEDLKFQQFFQF